MTSNINYAALNMDEIVFIDRNQDYGAFEIRQIYPQHIKRSLIGMMTVVGLILGYQELSALLHPAPPIEKEYMIEATTTEVKVEKTTPPPTPPITPPQGIKNPATANFAEMLASIHDSQDSLIPVSQLTADMTFGDHNTTGEIGDEGESTTDIAPPAPTPTPTPTPAIFDIAAEMPEYPGGEEALGQFIHNSISYPDIDREMGKQGTVVVQFVVNETGSVTDAHIARHISSTLDAEALRVVGLLKGFKPGYQNGHPVKVRMSLPFRYNLAGD
jgi:protein TonB